MFLKISRLVKRRTLAHEFCQKGWIQINGQIGKPGRAIKQGDRIVLDLWSRRKEVVIVEIPKGPVSRKDAESLYKVLSDEPESGSCPYGSKGSFGQTESKGHPVKKSKGLSDN